MLLDQYEPLFIIGDLNMDIRSIRGAEFKDFLIRIELKNFVTQHTRVWRNFYKNKEFQNYENSYWRYTSQSE